MRVELEQLSESWFQWRKGGVTGSSASVIMNENPFKTRLELWEELTGRREGFQGNEASRRGQALEPEARMYFNMTHGTDMVPACYQHDHFAFMRASLDGISSDGKEALEIKCSGSSVHEKVHSSQKPPAYYYAQMQQGMACSGAKVCQYMSYHPTHAVKSIVLSIPRDEKYIKKLVAAESAFWDLIVSDTPPEHTNKDYANRPAWGFFGNRLSEIDEEMRVLKNEKDGLRETLIQDAGGRSCRGGGITLTRSFSRGLVDYKAVPELNGVDLDKYRAESKEKWTLRLKKESQ